MLCMGSGLLCLIAASFYPPLPVVTAVALITVGASCVAVRRWPDRPLAMALHLMLYVGFTLLFAGARLHAASVGDVPWRMVDALDFYLAGGLVALAFSATLQALHAKRPI
jgi:hypothetical protein